MNVGDRVRVLHDSMTKGETGVIVDIQNFVTTLPYNVTLDNGETDWYYSADELEVIE